MSSMNNVFYTILLKGKSAISDTGLDLPCRSVPVHR